MSLRTVSLALALLAAAATWRAAPAMAQSSVDEIVVNGASTEGQDIRHQVVSYRDLDLHRRAGALALLARLDAAAKNVCEPEPKVVDLTGRANYQRCLRDAVSGAVYRVDNSVVSYLYGAHNQMLTSR